MGRRNSDHCFDFDQQTLWVMQLFLQQCVLRQCFPLPPLFFANEVISWFKLFFIAWIKHGDLWRTALRTTCSMCQNCRSSDWRPTRAAKAQNNRPEVMVMFSDCFDSKWPCPGQPGFANEQWELLLVPFLMELSLTLGIKGKNQIQRTELISQALVFCWLWVLEDGILVIPAFYFTYV